MEGLAVLGETSPWANRNPFIPHGHCYLWQPELVLLHLISDTLIGLAYYSIPITLIYFVRKRQDLPFNWIFQLFGIFIVACGTTHLMEVWTLWHPTYWLSGTIKFVTATVSVYTAVLLVPIIPQALALPSPAELEAANQELQKQVAERQQAEEALRNLNVELEERVNRRTAALTHSNDELARGMQARKQGEETRQALLKDLADLKFALDQSAIVATTDARGTIHYVNDKFCDISKYFREELVGQNHRLINSGYHPKEFFAQMWAAIRQGQAWQGEIKNRAKDGTFYWVDTTIVPFLNAEGKPYQYVAIRSDITERKQAEEALRESEERYRFLTNAMPQIVWTARPDGELDYYNQPWYDYTGMTFEQTKDSGWQLVLHPDDLLLCIDQWTNAFQTGNSYEIEYRFKRAADETYRWHLGRGLPMRNQNGEVVQWVGTYTDIDDQKQAEAEVWRLNAHLEQRVVERTVQLEAANKELEAFSYSVSHDLRAPLRSIDGFSQALLEDCAEKLDTSGKGHLQRIRAASQRMGELIDDLLKLSRMTRVEMRRETVALSALAQTIVAELQRTQPKRQVKFIIAEGLAANGDARLLQVVLENLLGNAWKFTSKRRDAAIEFGVFQHGDKQAFFVRDNGAGFDMAYGDKLFGAFQRLHAMTEFEGTGIGLATVARIIRRHGGQVRAVGAVGQGATFYFTL